MTSTKINITFVNGSPNEKQLRAFFSSKSHCGVQHGIIVQLQVTQNGAVLEYANIEDAEKVVKQKIYKWAGGTELHISLYDDQDYTPGGPTSGDATDDSARMVELVNIPTDTHKDVLDLYLDEEEVEHMDVSLIKSSGVAKVKFKTKEAAANLSKEGVMMVGTASVKVRPVIAKPVTKHKTPVDERDICISGIDPKWGTEILRKLVEKKGGPVDTLDTGEISKGSLHVQFKNVEAAEKLLQQSEFSFHGHTLKVSRTGASVGEITRCQPHRNLADSNTNATSTNIIHVVNIPTNTGKEFVSLLFKNKEASGGGPIEKLDFDQEKLEATIIFKNATDAMDVLNKDGLYIDDVQLCVTPLDGSYNTEDTCGVAVTGYERSIGQQHLKLYLEEIGGKIKQQDIYFSEDGSTVYITFETPECAARVLKSKTHVVNNVEIKVQRMKPAPPPPIFGSPIDETTLLLQHVSSKTRREDLKTYVETAAGSKIEKLLFSEYRQGLVLVEFVGKPDFINLRKKSIQRPLVDHMISVQQLPLSSALQIYKSEEQSDQYIELLINNAEREAIVDTLRLVETPVPHFVVRVLNTDVYRLVQKIRRKRPNLSVAIYHESFGLITPTTSHHTPKTWIDHLESTYDEKPKSDIDKENVKQDQTQRVILEGVNPNTHKDRLEIHLEDEEFLGEQANVQDIDMAQIDKNIAIVTFQDESSATKLLDMKEFVYDGSCVTVRSYAEEANQHTHGLDASKDNTDSRTDIQDEIIGRKVLVEGIDPDWKSDLLEKFFKQKKRGGGPISNIKRDETFNDIIEIEFKDPETAKTILERGKFSFEDRALYARAVEKPVEVKTIEVMGIPRNKTENFVQLFFESPKYASGGPVKNIAYDQKSGKAVIVFEETKDTDAVLKRQSKERLEIDDHKLQVHALDDSYSSVEICAVTVSGFTGSIDKSYIEAYFDNRRQSGGGSVVNSFSIDENSSVVITFASSEVANRVVQKRNHCIENDVLTVQLLPTVPYPPLIKGHTEADKLLLRHLSRKTSTEVLVDFLKAVDKCPVQKVMFSWMHKGIAKITFAGMPDFHMIREECKRKPLLGTMISVQRVPRPNSLQICNIEEKSEHYIRSLLGRDSIAGETFVSAKTYQKPMYHAIAEFELGTDLLDIITKLKKAHPEFNVMPYDEYFGLVPPNTSLDTADVWLPKVVRIDQPKTIIAEFILNNTSQQALIKSTIKSLSGNIEWPKSTSADEKYVIRYQSTHKMAGKEWATSIKQAMQDFMRNITDARIDILQELWSDFKKENGGVQNTNLVDIKMDDIARAVVLVGERKAVEDKVKILQKQKAEMEEKLQLKRKITTDELQTDTKNIHILQHFGFDEILKHSVENVSVGLDLGGSAVKFTGIPHSISESKVKMYEFLNKVNHKTMPLSPILLEIISTEGAIQYLKGVLKQSNLNVLWLTQKESLDIYATSKKDLIATETLLAEHLSEKTIHLAKTQAGLLQSDKWKLFTATHVQKSDDKLRLSATNSNINIAGTSDKVNTLYEEVDAFIKQNAIQEKFIKMPAVGAARLFSHKLDDIKKEFVGAHLQIDAMLQGRRIGFVVKGTLMTCNKVEKMLQQMATNIRFSSIPTTQQGIVEYFTKEDGREILNGLEATYDVTIDSSNDTGALKVGDKPAATEYDSPVVKGTVTIGKFNLIIAKADLPTYQCDAIVNAANENMSHQGGLAGAIVKRGGKDIQDECSAWIRSNGRLISPAVYVSKAGKLNCKKIIHAVGPIWDEGKNNEVNKLYQTVYEILHSAETHKFHSVALPALSTGIYRFPLHEAVRTITEAIADFCSTEPGARSLREIHLVDLTDDTTDEMLKAAMNKFGSQCVSRPDSVETGGATASNKTDLFGELRRSMDNGLVIDVPGKFKIEVQQGDIASESVDVVVHGSDSKLSLNGAVGHVLKRKAGDAFVRECKLKAQISDITEFTTAGNLPCKLVLHVDLSRQNKSVADWHRIVLTCLERADAKGMTSITFPAIGTGKLGQTPEFVSKILLGACTEYAQKGPTGIKRIRLTVYESDMANRFQNAMEDIVKSTKDGLDIQGQSLKDMSGECLTLVIYGHTDDSIRKVTERLNKIISEQIEIVILDIESDQDNIASLSPTQIQQIEQLQVPGRVQVTVNQGIRHKSIRIQGAKDDVHRVRTSIEHIFRETKDKRYAKLLAQQIRWEYYDVSAGAFVAYPDNTNIKIETKYQAKRDHCEWKEVGEDGKLNVIRVNFNELKEITVGSNTPPVLVRRTEDDVVPLPPNWSISTRDTKANFKEYVLDPQSPEFQDVKNKFCSQTGNRFNILEIKRIQNDGLYKQLKIKKRDMENHGAQQPIARELWHGTTKNTIQLVNNGGFNRSYCGKNATAYGKGVYFAVSAEYSCRSQYSRPDSSGHRYIYYCTVLTGNYTKGNSGLIDTPPMDPNNPHIKYDSVVNDMNNIEMFVIFNDTQAYPDYLIRFK